MINRANGIRLAMLFLTLVMMLSAAVGFAAEANPIRVSSLSEPQSVISPQEVDITIKVYNSGQMDMQEKITLYNPAGAPVETYEGLKAEQSVTYQGVWNVTAEEIKKGKISYYIQYFLETENGLEKTLNSVPVTIQTEAAAPQLTAVYTVSPQSARTGQTVNVAYTLSNTGNIELRNIVIENDGISKEAVKAVSLSVGEKLTLESSFTMGKKELVSKPTITYQAAGSDKKLTISDLAKKTITVAEDGLEVAIEAKQTENIYPGEKAKMTLKLKNSGNRAYTGLTAVGSDGAQIVSGVELAPGATHDTAFETTVTQDMGFSVTVSGRDSEGETIGVTSEMVELKTQDASNALVLNILAQAEQTTIYSEPAVVRMAVLVENIGQTDATALTVKEAGTTVAAIPALPAGTSRTLVFDVETSIAGKLQFTVTGKDATGTSRTYESNIIQINYIEPTPVPTPAPTPVPTPTPTPVPPTPTPEPTLQEVVMDKIGAINPVVLWSSAGVLGALLVVLVLVNVITSAQRKKRIAQAIDTIEIDRDYSPRDHRGARKGGKKVKTEKKPADAREQEIDPKKELTDERAAQMKAEARSEQPAREDGRRRRMQEREVPADRTLRVAPVDERPEFIAQGQVDDSQTRIFSPIDDAEPEAPAQEPSEPTIRINAEQVEEIREGEKKAAKKKQREELKKKKGLFSFGGKKKKKEKEEDDFIDDEYDDIDGDEDDFFE
ncbi:MAG: hypothetical protein IKU34_12120 [Clostridia bacterium]|nr:hypothetical protein [Clostridia bacterium]